MRYFITVIITIVGISGSSYAASQKHAIHPAITEQQAPQDKRGTEESPLIVKTIPYEKTDVELRNDHDKDLKAEAAEHRKADVDESVVNLTGQLAYYTYLLFIATSILAVFTALMVIVGFLQIRDAKETIAATKIAAMAAKKQADAAVGIELPIFLHEFVPVVQENNPDGLILFTNRGRTFAAVTKTCVSFFGEGSLPVNPIYSENSVENRDIFVDSQKSLPVAIKSPFSLEEWEMARRGEITLWIYGYFEFSDFLKQSHVVGFSFFSTPGAAPRIDALYDHPSSGPHIPPTVQWNEGKNAAYSYVRYKEYVDN